MRVNNCVQRRTTQDIHSKFFALCRFLLGLLITLIGLLGNTPITLSSSFPETETILTRASTFFLFSSASDMYSCLPTHRPTYVVPLGASVRSKGFPEAPAHSTEPSGGEGSPEIETITLGGVNLASSPGLCTSDHQELPTITAVGGGQRNLSWKLAHGLNSSSQANLFSLP